MSQPPIYLLQGMTPNRHVYDRLAPMLPDCQIVSWIEPQKQESIASYAQRLAAQIPVRDCYLGGVSFGGVVALEVARILQPKMCFLISSIRGPSQLPPWLRAIRLLSSTTSLAVGLRAAGNLANYVPRCVRSKTTMRTTKLAGEEGDWHRWACSAVLQWNPEHEPQLPVYQIHGDADRTFPVRFTSPDKIILSGGHLLPLTHPKVVAEAMLAVMTSAP